MTSFNSFGEAASHMALFRREWEGKQLDAKALAVAKKLIPEATKAASGDLGGDPAFSGWNPSTNWLETEAKIVGPGAAIVKPTPRSAGPWTVAERGRNVGETGRLLGPGVSQKTGLTSRTKSGKLRKVRAVQGKRWNGVTAGHRTATKAGVVFDREVPKLIERVVDETNTAYFG